MELMTKLNLKWAVPGNIKQFKLTNYIQYVSKVTNKKDMSKMYRGITNESIIKNELFRNKGTSR